VVSSRLRTATAEAIFGILGVLRCIAKPQRVFPPNSFQDGGANFAAAAPGMLPSRSEPSATETRRPKRVAHCST
jgi:hypothetical protein